MSCLCPISSIKLVTSLVASFSTYLCSCPFRTNLLHRNWLVNCFMEVHDILLKESSIHFSVGNPNEFLYLPSDDLSLSNVSYSLESLDIHI